VRFPGRRKHKHYFPVSARDPLFQAMGLDGASARTHVVGVDQTLVDIDARVPHEILAHYALPRGASTVIPNDLALQLYDELLATS